MIRFVLVSVVVATAALVSGAASTTGTAPLSTDSGTTHKYAWAPNTLTRVKGDGGPNLDLQLQGGHKKLYHMIAVAHNYDKRIGGLRIHVYGTCKAHPHRFCAKVRIKNYGWKGGWWGQTTFHKWGRLIQINTYQVYYPLKNNQMVACHELGHVLGLMHHTTPGCVSNTNYPTIWPSKEEIRVLRKHY